MPHDADPTNTTTRPHDLSSPARGHRGSVLATLLLVIGLLATGLAVWVAERHAAQADVARFEKLKDRLHGEVVRRLSIFEYGLRGSRSLWPASKSVERGEFEAMVKSRDLPREFPGATGIAYLKRVAREDMLAFLTATRADGAPDYAIRGDSDSGSRYMVEFVEPKNPNSHLVGMDAAQDPAWRDAADRAMASGKVELSDTVTVRTPTQDGPGLIATIPIYRKGAAIETAEERTLALDGWVAMPILFSRALAGTAESMSGELDFELFVGSRTGVHEPVYDADGHLALLGRGPLTPAAIDHRAHSSIDRFRIGGQDLTISSSTTPRFVGGSRVGVWGIGIVGVLMSLSTAGLVLALSGTAARASAMAAEATRGLRDQASELERLAMVVRETRNLVVVTDRHSRIVWVNPAFEKVTGYTLDEARGRVPGHLLQCERTDPAAARAMREAVARCEPSRVEILNRSKSGEEYWVEVEIQPFGFDKDGVPAGFLAIETIVTDRRRATEDLRRREKALAATARLAKVGWWELDLLTDRCVWSDEVRRIHEVGADYDPNLKNAVAFYPGEAEQTILRCVRGCADTGTPFDIELPFVTAKGRHLWVRGLGEAEYEHGKIVRLRGGFQDVTEQVAAREAATAASKSKSEFLANMSHEIRTPMTAILGYTDLLAEEDGVGVAPEHRQETIQTIRRNGEHLLALINDILDVSKIEAGKMTVESIPTDVVAVVEDVISLMRVRATGKKISLNREYATRVPARITSDPVRLKQVLVNLVGNAVKFTDKGGVTLRVVFMPAADGTAEGEGKIAFEIRDTGIGMTSEQVGRLFNAFEQGDTTMARRFGGTGLGLTISSRLCEMLGGTIRVSSTPGEGSVFVAGFGVSRQDACELRLPECDTPHATPDTARPTVGELRGVRVLLAEDGPDNQRLISYHLSRAGAVVTVVANGVQAVNAARGDGQGLFDVILMDMQMPEMDGYTAARTLRGKGSAIPIVALTAHAMSGDREKCLEAGCDDYTTKPIDRGVLIATVAKWAAKHLKQATQAM